jgi:DNA-binding beta-propeller fold protein YncE
MNRPSCAVVGAFVLTLSFGAIGAFAEDPPVFVAKWGSKGAGNGQFSDPWDVAISPSGHIYVVELTNNRVQKFTADGAYLSKWGSWGTADGQFRYPCSVAVDNFGNVYVADRANYRVQKFNANGGFLTKWGGQGTGDGQFNYVSAVAVDSSGNVYVADANDRIQKFAPDGTFLAKWGSHGTGNGQFDNPMGVAVSPAGYVYVSEMFNPRVQKFTLDGVFVTKWGGYGSDEGKFLSPRNVGVDPAGNVYVADTSNYRVQKFSSDGTFLTKWGAYGAGDGQFNAPIGVATDGAGYIYVTDSANARMQKFGPANRPPSASNQSVQTPGNTPIAITLSGSDPDHDPLTFAVASQPASGALSGAPPVLTYHPDTNFIGQDSVTFTASDGKVTSAPATVWIVVYDLTPPVISAQIDGTAGANGWYTSAVTVSWATTDPESGVLAPCPTTTIGANTTGTLVTCSVTNGAGLSSSLSATVRIDKTPPAIAGMPGPRCLLWPPNRELVTVATVSASAGTSALAAFSVSGSSSEPPSPGPDVVIAGSGLQPRTVQLRAERVGEGRGRVYTLAAVATNGAGLMRTETATCTVPHDQGK